jgi:hypothetical protein
MLTKQERKTIAERIENTSVFDSHELYRVVTGVTIPNDPITLGDIHDIARIILDLCDTFNMVELPMDKDGEVIKVGDTLYYGRSVYKVKKIIHNGNEWEIQFFDERLCISVYANPDDLTHKKPVTIASLNEQLRHVLDKGHMSAWSMAELFDIADKLEKLGDSDD